VDGDDLAKLAADFNLSNCNGSCQGDLTGDDVVDDEDLKLFKEDFGRINCPLP
jgi:hypothetical protein